jgi:hypothetical protein
MDFGGIAESGDEGAEEALSGAMQLLEPVTQMKRADRSNDGGGEDAWRRPLDAGRAGPYPESYQHFSIMSPPGLQEQCTPPDQMTWQNGNKTSMSLGGQQYFTPASQSAPPAHVELMGHMAPQPHRVDGGQQSHGLQAPFLQQGWQGQPIAYPPGGQGAAPVHPNPLWHMGQAVPLQQSGYGHYPAQWRYGHQSAQSAMPQPAFHAAAHASPAQSAFPPQSFIAPVGMMPPWGMLPAIATMGLFGQNQLPALDKKSELLGHLELVETTLREMGLLWGEAEFLPEAKGRTRNMVNLSLKGVTEIYNRATMKNLQHLTWRQLKELLVREFASPHQLKLDFERHLKNLTFRRPASAFIAAVSEVYYSYRLVFPDSSEGCRRLVDRVLSIVPSPISAKLVGELWDQGVDYQVAVPFASDGVRSTTKTFLSMLERALVKAEIAATYQADGALNRSGAHTSAPQVNLVQQPWLAEWVRGFKGVLYCYGANHKEAVDEALRNDNSLEVKVFRKGRMGPYALLGYKNEAPEVACKSRAFVLKEDSNSTHLDPENQKNL